MDTVGREERLTCRRDERVQMQRLFHGAELILAEDIVRGENGVT
jgi:hypothetical protein